MFMQPLHLMPRLGRARHAAPDVHLRAAAEWILRAQGATPDAGVAAFYDLKNKTWAASYPETTGYIIPTLYDYADYSGDASYAEHAEAMAQWESDIQLDCGGVRAGTMDADTVVPTIFNTGQVLFGWTRAYEESSKQRFFDSMIRAADWLVSVQDQDGAWRRHGSPFAEFAYNSYNTRAAFGLAEAARVCGEHRYLEAAVANVAHTSARAHANGWLDDNCLDNNAAPLTHTIAYSMRGILEVGIAADRADFVDLAIRMARAVAATQRRDGSVPGRLDRRWRPAARWTCVTGNAQLALNWLRIDRVVTDPVLRQKAQRALAYTQAVHDPGAGRDGVRGGLPGSVPLRAEYMRFRYPNWAPKFFMDALLLRQRLD